MAGAGWDFERRRAAGRAWASAALILATGFAWVYLLAISMHGVPPRWPQPASAATWLVVMAAIVLPGATPAILFHMKIGQQRPERGGGGLATLGFALGYCTLWALFGLGASAAQRLLDEAALLYPLIEPDDRAMVGGLLLAAGAYQLTPVKRSCLERCRAPLEFVLGHWRNGPAGGFVTGMHYGLYCLGSCAALMLPLVLGGASNLFWLAGVAALVLVEKAAPAGRSFAQLAGVGLVIWAALLAALELGELASAAILPFSS